MNARPTICPEHRTRLIIAAFETYVCSVAKCTYEVWFSPEDDRWEEAFV